METIDTLPVEIPKQSEIPKPIKGFQTIYNRHYDVGEINPYPSETIPDQALSVQEIMDKFAKGLQFDLRSRVPIYDGEDTLPDLANMDPVERQEFIEDYKSVITQQRKIRQDQINKETEARIEAEIKKRLEQRALGSKTNPPITPTASPEGELTLL